MQGVVFDHKVLVRIEDGDALYNNFISLFF